MLVDSCYCFLPIQYVFTVLILIIFQDYAIETPLEISSASTGGETFYEVKIDVNTSSSIAAINFVLKASPLKLSLVFVYVFVY